MRVKYINCWLSEIEKEINEFINNKKVIKIKFSTEGLMANALIIYEE